MSELNRFYSFFFLFDSLVLTLFSDCNVMQTYWANVTLDFPLCKFTLFVRHCLNMLMLGFFSPLYRKDINVSVHIEYTLYSPKIDESLRQEWIRKPSVFSFNWTWEIILCHCSNSHTHLNRSICYWLVCLNEEKKTPLSHSISICQFCQSRMI